MGLSLEWSMRGDRRRSPSMAASAASAPLTLPWPPCCLLLSRRSTRPAVLVACPSRSPSSSLAPAGRRPHRHMLASTRNPSAGANSLGVINNSSTDMLVEQNPNAQQPPPKYVKIWEGKLFEGYWKGTAARILAADWPETLEIAGLVGREHMRRNYRHLFTGSVVFRALNQHGLLFVDIEHGLLGELKENELCAVIRLPSQTLLLSTSEKAGRLLGMLLPGDVVISSQQ